MNHVHGMTSIDELGTKTILHLENEHLRFELMRDARTRIEVKTTGMVWEQGPVAFQERGDFDQDWGWYRRSRASYTMYSGRFEVKALQGGLVEVTVKGPMGRTMGTFRCEYRLEGEALDLKIVGIDASLPSLVYPTPIQSDALLLPEKQGKIVRANPQENIGGYSEARWSRHFHRNPAWNMRWFGGLRGPEERHGWLTITTEGYEDAGVLWGGTWASPAWMQSLGTWETVRKLRTYFTDGGWQGICKKYRQWSRAHGFWGKSLREKLEDNPLLDCMIGGRKIRLSLAHKHVPKRYEDVWTVPPADLLSEGRVNVLFSFKEAMRLREAVKAAGMKRGVFKYGGWGKDGYDERHPDVWPPAKELGTFDEFRALCQQDAPYMTCLHDNYYDVYEQSPNFPQGVCMDREGFPMAVGFWSGGQAYAGNPRELYTIARANAEKMAGAGCRNHYFDTHSFLSQSFDPQKPLTRTQDRIWKNKMFDASCELGMLTGSEDGNEFYVPHVHWSPKGKWGFKEGTLPLWPLIYNDANLGMRIVNLGSRSREVIFKRGLENMLLGFGTTFQFLSMDDWEAQREIFGETFHFDDWHRAVALEEMVDHHILSEDGQVRRTVWANGRAVTANLSQEIRETQEGTFQPLEYRTE